MSDSPAAPPLVSAEWLATHLNDASLLVIDVRSAIDGGGRAAYEAAHIPGAVHSDYIKDGWRASKGAATGLLPERAALAALFGRLGLVPERHAIIAAAGTGAGDFSAAARVYWTVKVAGHALVSLLDGGMAEWRRDATRPVEAGESRPQPAGDYPIAWAAGLRSDLPAVEAALASRSATPLDSRSRAYYEGRDKSPAARRAGRLPSSLHLDHALAFDPDTGRLRPRGQLERLYAAIPDRPVIHYCNTGQQAATNWFVMSEILGRPGSSLYDGSMSEWTESDQRPVATGPAPD